MDRADFQDQKHIVFVVTSKMTAQTFVQKFATFVAKQGIRVTIISDGLVTQTTEFDNSVISTVGLPMEREPAPFKDLISLVSLIRVLRSLKPDTIVYATPKASLLSSVASLVLCVPNRIYQVWGLRLETTVGLRRFVLSLMERVTCLCSKKVVANSRSLAARYTNLGLNGPREVTVLGSGSSHGVDLNYFSRTAPDISRDAQFEEFLKEHESFFKLGFVGRLHPDKGLDTLIETGNKLVESGHKVALVLIGEDEGAEVELNPSEDLEFFRVGHVKDVRPYYMGMDLLCLPSLREGFPNVVLEAASMELASVVSDGTGVVDSVVDGVTGFVEAVRDSEGFRISIEKLIADRNLLREFGAQARSRAEKHFDEEDVWMRNLVYFTS